MRITFLLALTLASTSIATVTQAQEFQVFNQQVAQGPSIQDLLQPRNQLSDILGRSELDRQISRGEQAMEAEDYEEAERLFRDVLQKSPPNRHEIHTKLGEAILHQVTNQVTSPLPWLQNRAQRSTGDAISEFNSALELEPDYFSALAGLYKSYEHRGDFFRNRQNPDLDQAIEDYRQANDYLDAASQSFTNQNGRINFRLEGTDKNRITRKLNNALLRRAFMR